MSYTLTYTAELYKTKRLTFCYKKKDKTGITKLFQRILGIYIITNGIIKIFKHLAKYIALFLSKLR